MRSGDLAVWPDQAATTSARGGPCLGVLSLVRDTLELNYCTKLFHQTVQIVQDEALYKCRLLIFEDPALEAQRRVVPKDYLSLEGILGGVSKPAPYR